MRYFFRQDSKRLGSDDYDMGPRAASIINYDQDDLGIDARSLKVVHQQPEFIHNFASASSLLHEFAAHGLSWIIRQYKYGLPEDIARQDFFDRCCIVTALFE